MQYRSCDFQGRVQRKLQGKGKVLCEQVAHFGGLLLCERIKYSGLPIISFAMYLSPLKEGTRSAFVFAAISKEFLSSLLSYGVQKLRAGFFTFAAEH